MGHIGKDEKSMFKQLLHIDALRGQHSTGLLKVTSYSKSMFKKAVVPSEFLQYKQADSMINTHATVLAGHNRHATVGAINSVNAHPFEHGDITGMHNGTLTNQKLLPDHERFDVDSENIVHSLDKMGVPKTMKSVHGAAALVWWNNAEKSLNFWRNDRRPLFFVHSKDGKTVMWASEEEMLHLVINRSDSWNKYGKSYPIKTEHHIKFGDITGHNVLECSVVKTPVYKPPVVVKTYLNDNKNKANNKPVTVTQGGTVITKGAAGAVNGNTLKQNEAMASLRKKYPVGAQIKVHLDAQQPYIHAMLGRVQGQLKTIARVSLTKDDAKRKSIEKVGGVISGIVNGFVTFNNVPQITLSEESVVSVVSTKKETTYVDSKGHLITGAHWDNLTACGCDTCSKSVYVPAEIGKWLAPNKFVCKSCVHEDKMKTSTFSQKAKVH